MRTKARGVDVFYRESGAGDPILFVHGIPDCSLLWEDVIARMAARYRCIAPDLPAFGDSKWPWRFEHSFENYGRFLDELVEAIGVECPMNLVAHDYGGVFATAWASMAPEKVRRMVAIDHGFFIGGWRWHPEARKFRTPVVGELVVGSRRLWPLFRRSVQRGALNLPDEKIRPLHGKLKLVTGPMVLRLYRTADEEEIARWEPRTREVTERIPTLVLWGDHEPYFPEWVPERFHAERVERVEGSGHWMPLEAPERVAVELDRFFAG